MLPPPVTQLPIGLALGILSTFFPTLLRPFVALGVLLLAAEAVLLYHAGGAGALQTSLLWLVDLVRNAALLIAGLGIGSWAGALILGQR